MALSLTTTGQDTFAGAINYREGIPAAGHVSLVNPALFILSAAEFPTALTFKLSSVKLNLRATIRRFAKTCFSTRWMSASWSWRCLKALNLVQMVVIAALVVQLVVLGWQEGQRSKRQEQAEQQWEQAKQHGKLADRTDHHGEVSGEREQLQAQLIELLKERVEVLEQRGHDNDHSSTPQRSSSNKPLF